MQLTLVTETYPPEVNGVAMTLGRLTEGMARRGHTIEVVCPRVDEAGPTRPRPPGVAEWRVPGCPLPFYRSLRMGWPVVGRLRRRWREQPPDLVHVATEGPLGWAALRVAQRLRLPVTSSFHTNFHHYGRSYGLGLVQGLAWRYLRWFHRRTRCTLVPTEEGLRQLAASGWERLGILSRGVDTHLFTPECRNEALRARWGASPEEIVVLYVGRLAAEKNLALAVEAWHALHAREPRLRFVLVGDGPERPALERRYPQFHYAGMRRGEDLAAHYASGDVFLFPSVTETFGNVVTEALASGLVVVAYDYAAAREYVRAGENGFLADFDRPAAFVAAAEQAWAQRGDWPALRARARATALTITWDRVIDQFETALEAARQG